MKIALFSDIHGNLPALEAVFEDIAKHQPDEIYCLGDLDRTIKASKKVQSRIYIQLLFQAK
ncbi:metallophosphoesterase family protein [Albibacterium bauzanense]|uniref:Calcineurin-like phosphoesterase family protein n=1 Tax=Albibacterium bauzanense TaxID=653929 RepID=A0A4R1LXQ7_9SPHI|nr:metallophosphatase family protein [Albibacterium bauzanense]TCK83647.1 calcineurin-like phosphoesterase family protein [Albibacterium bauzanense]